MVVSRPSPLMESTESMTSHIELIPVSNNSKGTEQSVFGAQALIWQLKAVMHIIIILWKFGPSDIQHPYDYLTFLFFLLKSWEECKYETSALHKRVTLIRSL